MLQATLNKYTFRFIALKTDVIVQQDAPTNLWKANLTLAVIDAPDTILPNDLFHLVENQLLEDGFLGWGIIKNGTPFNVSGVRVVQPNDNEGVPEDAILTISVDYRLLAQS